MIVKYKFVGPKAIEPKYAKFGDAGADIYATEHLWLHGHQQALVKTGIALEIPLGYVGLMHPRSGLAVREGITLLNSPGTIDSGYRGEIMANMINHSDRSYEILPGDRIAQMLFQKVELALFVKVDYLSDSERGEGGHGSSGA